MILPLREHADTAQIGGVEGLLTEADQPSVAPPISPFPIVISPAHAVRHRPWREAHDQVLAALQAGNGPVVVAAASGAGKTLFLQALAQELREGGADVFLLPRGDVPLAGDVVVTGRRRIVLIDGAERISQAALDSLRQLGEFAVVLAITSGPHATFGGAGTVVRLAALAPHEVGAFTAARLHEAGLAADLLTDAAVARLAELSEGVPRALNRLAGTALFLARAEGALRVEADHVDQAAVLGDASAGPTMPAAGPPRPASAEPERVIPVSGRTVSSSPTSGSDVLDSADADGAHAPAALPVTTGNARPRWVKPSIAAFAALSLLVLCGSLLLRPGTLDGRSRSVTAQSVTASHVPPPEVVPSAPSAAQPPAPRSAEVALAPPVPAAPPVEPAPTPAPPAPETPATPDTSPARGEVPLPASAPALVVVRYDRGASEAPSRAASYAAAVRAAGFAVDGPAPVMREGVKPGAHYFFSEDRDTAAAVLKAIGLPGREIAADLPAQGLSPRPGLIELVLSSDEAETSAKR